MCHVCVSSSADLAKATMSQFCTMPAGERKKRAAAICREVHGSNGMMSKLRRGLQQENSHSGLGSECQGYSPAVAINKRMFYSGSGGFVVVLFKCLFLESTGKLRGQLCGCLLCEGLWQLVHIPSCRKRKHHVLQQEFSSTIAHFPWITESNFLFHSYSEKVIWKNCHCLPDSHPCCMSSIHIYTEWAWPAQMFIVSWTISLQLKSLNLKWSLWANKGPDGPHADVKSLWML